jgi:DNA polymerase-3 subunit epsilon
VSIELTTNAQGYLQARLIREIDPGRLGDYYGLFRSKRDAERALAGIAAKNELCNRLLGLESEHSGPCFQRALGRCQGACEGREDPLRYNLRMQIAFYSLRLQTWPWKGPVAIIECNETSHKTDVLVVYNWVHVATVHDDHELDSLSLGGQAVNFDLDSYKLLAKALLGKDRGQFRIQLLPALAQPDVLMP